LRLEPELEEFHPEHRARHAVQIASRAAGTLLQGALIAAGGRVDPALGQAGPVIEWNGERLAPMELAQTALRSGEARAELVAWSQRLLAAAPDARIG
jgi:hypothetical protein